MSKYEARLESDLAHISEKLANLGEAVESALKNASRALFTAEEELAYKVILGDFPINRASRELDKICHGFFAVHLPSAGHLRFISSVMRVNLELERIGDYAVNICREAVQIGHPPEGILGQQMEGMSREVQDVLGKAIAAFKGGDPAQARSEIEQASQVTRGFDAVFKNLVSEEGKVGVRELLCYLVIFNMFSRVADQAKNICEETLYMCTGQYMKHIGKEVFRVLFVDDDNASASQIAEAVGNALDQPRLVFTSAGIAAKSITSETAGFLKSKGHDISNNISKSVDNIPNLDHYQVIVALSDLGTNAFPAPPTKTISIVWELGQAAASMEETYTFLNQNIEDLVQAILGQSEGN